MNKLWVIKEERKDLRDAIVRDLKVSPVLAQLLVNRDLLDPSTVHQFLYGTKSSLHDPFLLKNMQKAVDRIRGAITRGEKILVYGDYDADGVSSVALLLTYLRRESAQVDWYLPHRVNEGYGLNSEAVEEIRARGVTLVITVDCGVTDAVEVALLNSHHIDTIVVDHHEIQKDSLPAAYAIVNPLQEGCTYPFKELAGVGLAYKLACALAGDRAHDNEEFLDLVAVGTVADVVSQTGENRILTRLGLQRLSKAPRVGLQALMEVAGLGEREVLAEHIGFVIGPRINVAGRIGSPELALRLLLSEKKEEALEIAAKLHSENGLRQKMQEKIFKEAVAKIDGQMNFKDTSVIVVWDEGWHPGVIGIVASKLVGRYYRPAIVFSLQEGRAKGSGRSIDNFNLLEAVSSLSLIHI